MNNKKQTQVTISMGAGGKQSLELLKNVVLPVCGNEFLNRLDDSAEILLGGERIAYTTDSYTIKPIFFPGGDIGKISVCGTCNDLSVKGAKPLFISAGVIIEEGFSINSLKKIVSSMSKTAKEIGVKIVTGDTKVVNKGEADGIFINTSGIGIIFPGMDVSCSNAKKGDDIIITGSIGDHGISILNARENLGLTPEIQSDVGHVYKIVKELTGYSGNIHVMRDPTRGGLASTLNEIAMSSKVNITIYEDKIPIKQGVRKSCDILGLDPLYIANEGKIVMFVSPEVTKSLLDKIKSLPHGKNADVIGKVENSTYTEDVPPVAIQTLLGLKRFVPLIEGESLPRIC
ncbi:MAG: hydrogenase expression/formation protein HypE [Candidatus Omnitrophica bacterium]|nr:hydrogenase expression/formation protein HypE [Candidatus Omnitrophota bacterium]